MPPIERVALYLDVPPAPPEAPPLEVPPLEVPPPEAPPVEGDGLAAGGVAVVAPPEGAPLLLLAFGGVELPDELPCFEPELSHAAMPSVASSAPAISHFLSIRILLPLVMPRTANLASAASCANNMRGKRKIPQQKPRQVVTKYRADERAGFVAPGVDRPGYCGSLGDILC